MGTFIKRGGWLIGLGLLLIIGAAWLALSARATMARLASDGVMADARIEEMWEQVSTSGGLTRRSSESETRVWFATVTFTTADGAAQRVTQIVSKPWYDTWFPGQMTQIRYLPDDPAVFEIDPGTQQRTNLTGAAFLAGFALLPILLGAYMVRLFNGKARLRAQGQSAVATLTDIKRNGAWRILVYSFVGPDGRRYRGRSLPKTDARYDRMTPGSVVEVLFDPVRPANNRLAADLR